MAGCSCTDHGTSGPGFPLPHPRLHTAWEGTVRGALLTQQDTLARNFSTVEEIIAAHSALPGSMCLWVLSKATGGLMSQRWMQNSCYFLLTKIFKAGEVTMLPLTVGLSSAPWPQSFSLSDSPIAFQLPTMQQTGLLHVCLKGRGGPSVSGWSGWWCCHQN